MPSVVTCRVGVPWRGASAPGGGGVALGEPEMAQVSLVVVLKHPELRARPPEAVLGEPHLHVQQGGKALLEDGPLLRGGLAQRVELRVGLQREEVRPVLGSVGAQARHGRGVSESRATRKAGTCIWRHFPLEEAFRISGRRAGQGRRAGHQDRGGRSRRSRRAGAGAAAEAAGAGVPCATPSVATSSGPPLRCPSRSACTRRWTRSAALSSIFPASWSRCAAAPSNASPPRSPGCTRAARGSTWPASCATFPSPSPNWPRPTSRGASPHPRQRPPKPHRQPRPTPRPRRPKPNPPNQTPRTPTRTRTRPPTRPRARTPPPPRPQQRHSPSLPASSSAPSSSPPPPTFPRPPRATAATS